jgi:hypothetical protein
VAWVIRISVDSPLSCYPWHYLLGQQPDRLDIRGIQRLHDEIPDAAI